MAKTLGDIIDVAVGLKRRKEWLKALKIYRLIFEAAPFDSEIRLDISDAIMALGFQDLAALAYEETCKFAARAGYPLLAIDAAKKLSAIENWEPLRQATPLTPASSRNKGEQMLHMIAQLYGSDSTILGKTTRLAPVDRQVPVQENVDLDFPVQPDSLARTTVELMIKTSETTPFPSTLPPIPILSDLPPELFVKFLAEVSLIELESGKTILLEGEEASTFYMIIRGRVSIWKAGPTGKRINLASLGEGSIFGEMALITQLPRTANVETTTETHLLEFQKSRLEELSKDSIVIEAALERFTRERLIGNLLATNPIFQPFDKKQRYELLTRFTAHEVTPGTILVRSNQEGRGLYIILYGSVDVLKQENGKEILIATLHSGDIFGEISLIKDTPTTATVRAATHSTILFLPKEYFQKLVESIPHLKEYFAKLSEERLTMAEKVVARAREMEEQSIIQEDELIII